MQVAEIPSLSENVTDSNIISPEYQFAQNVGNSNGYNPFYAGHQVISSYQKANIPNLIERNHRPSTNNDTNNLITKHAQMMTKQDIYNVGKDLKEDSLSAAEEAIKNLQALLKAGAYEPEHKLQNVLFNGTNYTTTIR